MKNGLDEQYIDLLKDILENGVEKDTRNGKVLSVFGRSIRYKFKDGKFPLLTTKKMAWKTMVTELLWFLRGDTSIEYLLKNDCNIWTGDAYKNYTKSFLGYEDIPSQEWFINEIKSNTEFAKRFGELGPVYGKQWRRWEINEPKNIVKTENVTWPYEPNPHTYQQRVGSFKITQIDQIANLINGLKTNPDSRRLMVNAWNVGEIDQMVLPPCHYGFQVYTRELSLNEKWEQYTKSGLNIEINGTPLELKHMGTPFYPKLLPQRAISLIWNQRSCDVPLGIPMNISSYALLLMMIADEVNMVPDELIGNLGDCHIYLNQIEGVKEQIGREPYPLPKVSVRNGIHCSSVNDVILENYQSHPKIYFPLSN